MVRCWIYSAGPDQCQCYNVDDENLADLAAQAQSIPPGLFLRQTVLLTTSQRTELPMPSRNAVSIAA